MANKWSTTKISDISENLDSKRVPVARLKRKPGDIPYYGATGIVDYVDDYIFDEELLLIGEDGADWSGGANTTFIINGKSWVNNHAHVLRIKDANIQFVMNYLNYSDLRNYISGTTRGKLNQASLNKIIVPDPPVKTQQKIADVLSSVDDATQKTDQIIQNTEKLKQGLMNELLTKGIGHKKFKKTKLGEIPEEWEFGGIENIVNQEKNSIKPGPFGSSLKKNMYVKSGYKVYGQEQVISGNYKAGNYYINESKFKEMEAFSVQEGDVLISLVGTIGQVLVVGQNWEKGIINPRLMKITPNQEKCASAYLSYLLSSHFIRLQLNAVAQGGTMDVLNGKNIRRLRFGIPTLKEQKEIIQILATIDEKIIKEVNQNFKLMLLKKGLMKDIFSQKVLIN